MKSKEMKILFITGIFLMALNVAMGQKAEVCLSEEEISLANSINKLRQQNDLEAVKLSQSLSYVADVHTKDLYFHFDPYGACGLYLWSDEGRWAPCCPAGDEEDLECMYDKPHELTGYRSKGYEAVFYNNTGMTDRLALEYLKQDSSSLDLVLNTGRYTEKKWNAMGISVFEGFASVWFGELMDKKGEPALCSDTGNKPKNTEAAAGDQAPRYFVYVRSYQSKSAAEEELKNLKQRGLEGEVLPYKSRFRVALGPYKGFSQAKAIKQKVASDYEDAWIQNVSE